MLTLPEIVDRPRQPYLSILYTVRMEDIPKAADEGFPELFGWLAERDISPAGAPFFRYRRIAMAETLDIEVGVPVDQELEGDTRVHHGVLPRGKYGRVQWTGAYRHLLDVNAVLIGWAKEKGISWDVVEKDDGDHFACRLEVYETGPVDEPDPARWVTELLIKVAD